MFLHFHRFFFSLIRWPRSHGFGIQAPFAFHFVTQVVRDKNYYDFYESLDFCHHDSALRLRKFYLRLFNFLNSEQRFNEVYIIEGIHQSEANYALWKSVVQSSKVVVSFDLYDCGVVFLDGNMPKINYKVMLV